ncbi:hypothetical protein BDA99DRAFT_543757 [Phascolomyces articulosus]|uniref:Uncharacterized protein n=1 Tax=Phascolomyces articulosus TaxID=60185 RepID=A0AAD5P7P7_9FUNG|nr:hypothetical protein BDA99DRAFT_543757 [Phascolomyces articulosus]
MRKRIRRQYFSQKFLPRSTCIRKHTLYSHILRRIIVAVIGLARISHGNRKPCLCTSGISALQLFVYISVLCLLVVVLFFGSKNSTKLASIKHEENHAVMQRATKLPALIIIQIVFFIYLCIEQMGIA